MRERVLSGPAAADEVGQREGRRHHAHEDQQLEDGHERDHEFDARRDLHAGDVERHEHDVRTHSDPARLQPGYCTCMYAPMASAMAGGAKRNSMSVAMPATTPPIGPNARRPYSNGPAGMRDCRGELGEAEDERGVHHGHEGRRHEEAERAGRRPAVAPPEVLAGDDQPHRDPPELERAQRLLEAHRGGWADRSASGPYHGSGQWLMPSGAWTCTRPRSAAGLPRGPRSACSPGVRGPA